MMNFRTLISVPGLLLLTLAQAGAQDNYLLGVKTSDLSSVAAKHHLVVVNDIEDSGGSYLVRFSSGTGQHSQAASLVADPAVSSLEPDLPLTSPEQSARVKAVIGQLSDALAASSVVPFYGSQVRSAYIQQTATNLLELSAARQITTGAGIVAVIDTGVDPFHPALAGALVQGYDFTRNQATVPNELQDLDPVNFSAMANSSVASETTKTQPLQLQGSTVAILDQSTVAILDGATLPLTFGHGTMTAGLIHLVAPTASIMPLKAFNADGSANLSDIVRAIYFAVDHGARVINMSFDIEIPSAQLRNAIDYANENRVICVAAAGNDGEQEIVYPAILSKVIGVGSTDNSDQRSSFSNYGTNSVFMAAPGEGLITTFPGSNYAGVWGTSFSTALVSGTVAALVQLDPELEYSDAADALSAGVNIPNQQLGRDRLDVLRAVQSFLHQR
jgi:subtilisin family serine protease